MPDSVLFAAPPGKQRKRKYKTGNQHLRDLHSYLPVCLGLHRCTHSFGFDLSALLSPEDSPTHSFNMVTTRTKRKIQVSAHVSEKHFHFSHSYIYPNVKPRKSPLQQLPERNQHRSKALCKSQMMVQRKTTESTTFQLFHGETT